TVQLCYCCSGLSSLPLSRFFCVCSFFFFSSRRRHTRFKCDWSSDVCSSDLSSPARDLYRRTGEDPTKLRPSSEALLRRVLRGEALYRINSLVDTCNLCSLEFLLPIGLYDADRIQGTVTVRLGAQGEGYDSLGKGLYS